MGLVISNPCGLTKTLSNTRAISTSLDASVTEPCVQSNLVSVLISVLPNNLNTSKFSVHRVWNSFILTSLIWNLRCEYKLFSSYSHLKFQMTDCQQEVQQSYQSHEWRGRQWQSHQQCLRGCWKILLMVLNQREWAVKCECYWDVGQGLINPKGVTRAMQGCLMWKDIKHLQWLKTQYWWCGPACKIPLH